MQRQEQRLRPLLPPLLRVAVLRRAALREGGPPAHSLGHATHLVARLVVQLRDRLRAVGVSGR